jgi:hypothetical protein
MTRLQFVVAEMPSKNRVEALVDDFFVRHDAVGSGHKAAMMPHGQVLLSRRELTTEEFTTAIGTESAPAWR